MARTWKQPRCPSADEWIRKLWCIYNEILKEEYISSLNLKSLIFFDGDVIAIIILAMYFKIA